MPQSASSPSGSPSAITLLSGPPLATSGPLPFEPPHAAAASRPNPIVPIANSRRYTTNNSLLKRKRKAWVELTGPGSLPEAPLERNEPAFQRDFRDSHGFAGAREVERDGLLGARHGDRDVAADRRSALCAHHFDDVVADLSAAQR